MKNLFLFVLFFSVFVGVTKGAEPVLAIKLNNNSPVQYCTTPKVVAGSLTIDGTFAIQGMYVSFSEGYISGEDTLVYSGTVASIKAIWEESYSRLHLVPNPNWTGTPTRDDYQEAIKLVTYQNKNVIKNIHPTLGKRKISISLDDADYFEGHFYKYIPNFNIKWSAARIEAESDAMKYVGLLRGYLATITSEGENKFINNKTSLVGWIGATDETHEGDWRWVTGPEGRLDGGQGLLFWKGTGAQAKSNPAIYGSQNGAYQNWNTDNNEPNNAGNENYAHITIFPNNPSQSHKWNDLRDAGGAAPLYTPQGYLIEYGGMEDITFELSATLELQVNTMSFFKTGVQPAICEGDSVVLNKADTSHAVYSWTPPDLSLSSLIISNPTAKPKVPSTFFVTGIRGACSDTASYKVPVNPKPVVSLGRDTTICNPKSILLVAGAVGQFSKYSWTTPETTLNGREILVTKPGTYAVKIEDFYNCIASDEIKIDFVDKPKMTFPNLQTLICGKFTSTLDVLADKPVTYTLVSDPKVKIEGLTASVLPAYFGTYPVTLTAKDEFSCVSDTTFTLGFYKTPTVRFDFDSTTCKGYNLPARYTGDADTIVSNFKWVFGGEVIADTIGRNFLVVPLGINRSQRDLQLTVTQDGCDSTFTQKNIKVIPNLDLQIVDSLGCEPFNAEFKAINTEVVKYFWDFGDNTPVKEGDSIASHIYQKAAFYDVKLKVITVVTSGDGCTNEVKIDSMVHVAPVPVVTFSLSPNDCLEPGSNEISFTGTGLNGTGNDHYIWDLNDFTTSEQLNNPQETPGPFKFDLITKPSAKLGLHVISEFGCESTNEYTTVKRKPDFSINTDLTAGCVPFKPSLLGVINVKDIIDRVDFNWNITDGSAGSGSPYSPTFNDPDKTYSVTLKGISSETQCPNEVIQPDFLRTNPKPQAAFSMDHKVVYNDQPEVKFTDQSTGKPSAWLWDFGDGVTAGIQNPIYNFVKLGHQRVMLEVTNDELCTDTVSHNILVAFDRLFPPNGFSPNAPNVDDRVFLLNSEGIVPEGYHFTVLSRWNDLIFEAKDEIKGWDGRMKNGSLAPAGAYVWILNFNDFLGRKHRQTGAVTLVY